jgi:hypothetical protein
MGVATLGNRAHIGTMGLTIRAALMYVVAVIVALYLLYLILH